MGGTLRTDPYPPVKGDGHALFTMYQVRGVRQGTKVERTYVGSHFDPNALIANAKVDCTPHASFHIMQGSERVAVIRGGRRVA